MPGTATLDHLIASIVISVCDSQHQLDCLRATRYRRGMDKPASSAIIIGKVRIQQPAPGADLLITHRSHAGEATITVPADKLHRWVLRLLRDEVFA